MKSVLEKIADLGVRAVPDYDLIGFPYVSLERINFDDLCDAVKDKFKRAEPEIKRLMKERGVSKRLVANKTVEVLLLQEILGAANALFSFLPADSSLICLKPGLSAEEVIRWLLLDWRRMVGDFWYCIWIKSAEPALKMEKKLKRKITYYAEDGTAFDTRMGAKKYELDLARKKRIETCLRAILPDPVTLSWDTLVTTIVSNAGQLSDALSARAAARALPRVKVQNRPK